ncbi:MAG: DNA-binding protein YbiB [Leptothrix sp. (in: Bacteria)]|nr:DNA-binding protein YbiB [Leptothrix sp. (in: b-proteobacteria)]
MSISAYIKVIGRGKDGARPLTAEQAHDLMSQVLAGQVTDLEVGAFCLAMRIKGEEVNELDGFVRATLAHCLPIPAAPSGVVVLPSYNGARKLPNLTPLLALQLAKQGVAVLVHGPRHDPTRVTTAQVFGALGLPTAASTQDVQDAWQAGRPAFMDIATLCPPLAKLLDVRWTIGLRNPGHTVAKLLDPIVAEAGSRTMRVVNHTHPEYAISLNAYLKHAQANALLMRGTEGEPVADPRRQPRFDVFIKGLRDESLSRAPVDGVLTELPELPNGFAADTTARYIQELMSGQQPLPSAISAQVNCLVQALKQA